MSEQTHNLISSPIELPITAKMHVHPPGPWSAVLKHKRLAMACFTAIMLLTVGVILFAPRKYHSVTKLFLRDGRENVTLDPTTSAMGDTQSVHRTRESEILTAIEMMTSREILEGILERVGQEAILSGALPGCGKAKEPGFVDLVMSPVKFAKNSIQEVTSNIDPISDHELAINKLEGGLDISAPSEAGVVTIEYRTKTPQLAQKVVEEWIDLFQAHYLKATQTRGAFDFFVEQDRVLKNDLEAAREELRKAKNKFGLVTITGQQQIAEQQIQTIELALLTVDASLSESKTRVNSLGSLAENIESTKVTQNVTVPNQARDSMRSRLYDLEVEEKRLRAQYTDDHPFVLAVSEQVASAAEAVKAEEGEREQVTLGINPIRQVVDERLTLEQAEVEALSRRATALKSQKKRMLDKLTELNKHEEIVSTLDRKIEILEERYRSHAMRFEQARLDQVMQQEQISSVNVVQKPSLEFRPVSPRKKICAVLGLFAALAASIGLPMWIEANQFSKLQYANPATLISEKAEPTLVGSAENS